MSVHAIGDSVMQGAGHTIYNTRRLTIPGLTEDAEHSRQFPAAVDRARAVLTAEAPPDTVVIALGTNGRFRPETFDAVVALGDTTRFAFVNVKVPRSHEAPVSFRASSTPGIER
jgi:lysophospholipase L1-like esterase